MSVLPINRSQKRYDGACIDCARIAVRLNRFTEDALVLVSLIYIISIITQSKGCDIYNIYVYVSNIYVLYVLLMYFIILSFIKQKHPIMMMEYACSIVWLIATCNQSAIIECGH